MSDKVEKREEFFMSRSLEQKLREAVRYVGSGGEEKSKPIRQRKKRPSAIEKRLRMQRRCSRRDSAYGSHLVPSTFVLSTYRPQFSS
jgi:hypothetical protein